ncbi:MAG: hypothetical protein WC758_06930 [Candidatus Woesearchaeota archaeon]|jgi:hypothetical protein
MTYFRNLRVERPFRSTNLKLNDEYSSYAIYENDDYDDTEEDEYV